MYNLIRADLFKIRKTKAIKVLFGITTFSALIMVWIAYSISQGEMNNNIAGIGFMFSDVNMISILGAVLAAIFICGDFENKIIHEAIVTGNSRSSVIIGKAIVFIGAVAFILVPYVAITVIALITGSEFSMGSIAVGFLNIITSEAGNHLSVTEIGKLVAVIITLLFVYMAQLSICLPFALLLRKPVLVVTVYYGLTILCAQLTSIKGTSKIFDRIFALTPYGGMYSLTSLASSAIDFIKAIFVSFIFMILMFSITCLAFRRSEIK
ncbi:MAG: hypothetical protein K0S47_1297 [Herbinix sp.]|jgi:ABC-2 type transport system permease protein|nr:hypothetical protein [Herbinix sp.]